jgi:hypothetical protein
MVNDVSFCMSPDGVVTKYVDTLVFTIDVMLVFTGHSHARTRKI